MNGRACTSSPPGSRSRSGRGSLPALGYDTLVYALGSNIDLADMPGAADHASSLTGWGAAGALHERLDEVAAARGTVVVCGGGLTGIETAAELAESFPALRVRLVSSAQPGGWFSVKAQAYLRTVFADLAVEVTDGVHIAEVGPGGLSLAGGGSIPFDECVWAGGFAVPTLAADVGLRVDGAGRALVDSSLRSLSHPDVYVIGDAAAIAGKWGDALAMGCRTGTFTGPQVADTIARRLTGREPKPFRFRYHHECVSLGRRHGVVQFLRADGTTKDRILTGRAAIAYKNMTLLGALLLFRRPGPYVARRRHVAPRGRKRSRQPEKRQREETGEGLIVDFAQDDSYRQLRPLAFAIAYRMLGSISEAEDVEQEALLRLHVAAGREDISSPEAYLTTVATRLSIDNLRSARVRRERYFGDWLPEPLVGDPVLDAAEHAETADSLSMAFLVLLETLTPVERAAFLLREVFGYGYREIASVVGRSEANCRQLVSRARGHIDQRRPRFEASRRQRVELAERFFAACEQGDLPALIDLLAADVVFTGDGGGKVPPGAAISQPVFGREGVARLLTGFVRRLPGLRLLPTTVNGQPGALMVAPDGQLISVTSIDVADGLVQGVRSIINPEKLRHLGPTADLDRLAREHRAERRKTDR